MKTPVERFLSKFTPLSKEECWIWGGSVDTDGYGQFSIRTRRVKPHRFSYEHYRGPIGRGLEIDHLCKVRNCVNPWHMEPVSHKENMRRSDAAKVSADKRRAKSSCKRGHALAGSNVIQYRGCRSCRTCRLLNERKRRAAARAAA